MTRQEPTIDPELSWSVSPRTVTGSAHDGLPAVPPSTMSELVERTDWAAGPLGAPETWPQSLRTAVGICLSSRFPILLWWGPELVMVYNDAYRPMLGQSKHPRALGAPGKEVWTEIWDVIGPMLDQVMAGGGATWSRDELLVLDRNGYPEECYFTYSYSPITDESGGVGGVFCAVTETTERVIGGRRLATLADLAGLMGSESRAEVLRTAGTVLGANPGDHPVVLTVDAPLELDRLDLAANLEARVPESSAATRARLADLVRQAAGTGRVVRVPADEDAIASGTTAWHAHPVVESGTASHARAAAVVVFGEAATRRWDPTLEAYATLAVSHVAAALTEVRQLTEERRRRQDLVELDEAKSAFFTNISHELRTPLTLISGPLQEALAVEEDAAQRRRLELVHHSARRLGRMVDAMLDFGRMEAGRLEPQPTVVDVSEVVRGLAESFRPAAERAGLDFAHDCDDGIRAVLDRDMFERVVLNLLSNAVKYTPAGSVRLTLRCVDDDMHVAVSDTGIGIDPSDVDRAFARFERLPAADGARSHDGAGIGLAMVKQLTDLMGGTVAVCSEVGRGSTFTVRLPAIRPGDTDPTPGDPGSGVSRRGLEDFLREVETWERQASTSASAAELSGGAGAAGHDGRPRVLVAEDNVDLRTYLGDVLGDLYHVELVPDGRAALEAVHREVPDLVVADVMMPVVDGYQLVEAIRQDPVTTMVPVVLLSARAGEAETSSGLEAGADDYLVKPFSVVELRARIASNLERAGARMQDASWRRAVVEGFHDALVLLDLDGRVVEVNDRFTRMLGWRAADGPLTRPYPWDVPAAGGGARATFADVVDRAWAGRKGTEALETTLVHREGHRVVASVRVSVVDGGRRRPSLLLATLRDVTAEHEARQRRAMAARLAAELGAAEELTDVVATAVAGLGILFAGDATVCLQVGNRQQVFTASGPVTAADLDRRVARALAGEPGDGEREVPVDGILLTADGGSPGCRVWVAFPAERTVTPDERIAGDLLVQALGLALDRVVAATSFAEREQHLRRAITSHEEIGQAVGILVERHRWTPTTAFERLKRASQDHNIKLREVAVRVIDSGADPDDVPSS